MLHGAKVAVCSEIETTQLNTVWAECTIFECETCWCMNQTVTLRGL